MMPLTFVSLDPGTTTPIARLSSGYSQVDLATGGGFARGSTFLLAGDPGAGKSTLLVSVAANVARRDGPDAAVYVTSEQTVEAIQALSSRLRTVDAPVRLAAADNPSEISAALLALKTAPAFVVIDSLQRLVDPQLKPCRPGTLIQTRSALQTLIRFAQLRSSAVAIVCHITKSHVAAGPNDLQHDVDAVFYLTAVGRFRELKPTKNRFGPTDVAGIFALTDEGYVE